ncbi:MAG: insulinase family protein [Lachnospiraceae bacterium]
MNREKKIHGFHVLSVRRLDELQANLHEMEHTATGAHLIWLERPDENKTFGIAFPTHPEDDTGVFHILEHPVLGGSKRYPVKEPFLELMKSSLNTFLNALTYPDKTLYPVSSRNNQDFLGLVRVYMDAVLHPAIYEKPEIFGQEGWHYEFTDSIQNPIIKGVVFNEMKGACSLPDSLLASEITRRLFPDNCYRFVSGGDPAHIPDLTYEQFIETHRRFYHPSNAYIFLDGQIDIEQILDILDTEYLSEFTWRMPPSAIPRQEPVNGGAGEILFDLPESESLEGRARLAIGCVFADFSEHEKIIAAEVLADVLCGDNMAPLTACLLSKGLAGNVRLQIESGLLQSFAVLEAQDILLEKKDEVFRIIKDELTRLVREGLNHDRILAALDNFEFQMRERDFGSMPKGLVFGINILDSWLYGGDPAANLVIGDLFQKLRGKCEEGYFENLTAEMFLKNPHTCQVVMRPVHTLAKERQAAENQRIIHNMLFSSWEDIQVLRGFQKQLLDWQNSKDTPEALKSLPVLKLSDISAEAPKLPTAVRDFDGSTVLWHQLSTEGILYLNLYFEADDLTEEELALASFLCKLLGNLDTADTPCEKLQRRIRSLFGSLSFTMSSFGDIRKDAKASRTFLRVSASILEQNICSAVHFLCELLTETLFTDQTRIYELLHQHRTNLNEQIIANGHSFALRRASASVFAASAVQEYTGGIYFYQWLSRLEEDFKQRSESLGDTLSLLCRRLFCTQRMTCGITSFHESVLSLSLNVLKNSLGKGAAIRAAKPLKILKPCREGIQIPAEVAYVGAGFDLASCKVSYHGQLAVLERIISLAYLWNTVRVQGGAYGCGMNIRSTGLAGFYSFRDPAAARTLGCYSQCPGFLEEFLAQETDLTSYIIGAVAQSDPLLTPRMAGLTADSFYWQGITQEKRDQIRREMLSTTPEDLQKLIRPLDTVCKQSSICVLGSEGQLKQCSEYLEHIISL